VEKKYRGKGTVYMAGWGQQISRSSQASAAQALVLWTVPEGAERGRLQSKWRRHRRKPFGEKGKLPRGARPQQNPLERDWILPG
jgi:hypothetical protein